LRAPRQASVSDWLFDSSNDKTRNHKKGINCLFTDGSVTWHATPPGWYHGSWDQLDRGVLVKFP
jgi:prepilin-type processing-associated H-X9-DG protein